MSIYSVEVIVRKLNDNGVFIEDTLMDETAQFSGVDGGRGVRVAAASEAAMLVMDTLDPQPIDA